MNQLEIEKKIRLLKNNWKLINNKIQINIKFSNFSKAFDFMIEIAKECDRLNHHPLWTNEYNRLEIILFTHDKGSITELDFKLAEIIDKKLINLK
ncbi:4a-hydroxytetrahydrobiopterin dehydratase [Flavobacteriaceae bacterium]|nr:4a-hydroxytetrahydrobiopterin dehydratase [Flavobacteriaceae bacterium]